MTASRSSSPLAEALRGIRVLDLSRLLPGPFLTMVLADMGADVVKVEKADGGDDTRQFGKAAGMAKSGEHRRLGDVTQPDDGEPDGFDTGFHRHAVKTWPSAVDISQAPARLSDLILEGRTKFDSALPLGQDARPSVAIHSSKQLRRSLWSR